jgi:hypothetical protein
MVYNKLGRQADAEAIVSKLQADRRDGTNAVFYAMIYAQWDETGRALGWLDTAMRRRDPYLVKLKVNASFDPLPGSKLDSSIGVYRRILPGNRVAYPTEKKTYSLWRSLWQRTAVFGEALQ